MLLTNFMFVQIAMAGIFVVPFMDKMRYSWKIFDNPDALCFFSNGVAEIFFFNTRIKKLQYTQRHVE